MKYNIFNVLAQNVLIVYGIEIIISVFVIIFFQIPCFWGKD